jgi:uncharacterized repeat protein (TIGR03943 family)
LSGQALVREDPTWPGVRIDLSDVQARRRAAVAGWAAAAHEGIDSQDPSADPSPPPPEKPASQVGTSEIARQVGSPELVQQVGTAELAPPAPELAPATGGRTPGTRIGWLLVLAALTVLVLSPPALGPESATRTGTTATASGALAPALPSGDPVPLSLVDYVRHAAAGGTALADRRVLLVGFVLAGPRNEPYLARMVLGCCAAGAQPVKVGLVGNLPGVLAAGQWLAVVGTFTPESGRDPVNGELIPYLSVVTVEELAPPANPYET